MIKIDKCPICGNCVKPYLGNNILAKLYYMDCYNKCFFSNTTKNGEIESVSITINKNRTLIFEYQENINKYNVYISISFRNKVFLCESEDFIADLDKLKYRVEKVMVLL